MSSIAAKGFAAWQARLGTAHRFSRHIMTASKIIHWDSKTCPYAQRCVSVQTDTGSFM